MSNVPAGAPFKSIPLTDCAFEFDVTAVVDKADKVLMVFPIMDKVGNAVPPEELLDPSAEPHEIPAIISCPVELLPALKFWTVLYLIS